MSRPRTSPFAKNNSATGRNGSLRRNYNFEDPPEQLDQHLSVMLPDCYFHSINKLVQDGVFPSKAEAYREAIRRLVKKERTWRASFS
jgi:hypothetical protein